MAVVKYTPEQTVEIVATYKADPTRETVNKLATKFGKTFKSMVAKLVREQVYVKPEYVSKTGEKPKRKESLVDEIASEMNVDAESMDSLSKASKAALKAVFAELVQRRQMVEALQTVIEKLDGTIAELTADKII